MRLCGMYFVKLPFKYECHAKCLSWCGLCTKTHGEQLSYMSKLGRCLGEGPCMSKVRGKLPGEFGERRV